MSRIEMQPPRFYFGHIQNPNSYEPEWPKRVNEQIIKPLVDKYFEELLKHPDAVALRTSIKDGKLAIEWLDRKDVYMDPKL